MRAAAVGVDAEGEADVGAVVVDDDRAGGVLKLNRLRGGLFFVVEIIAIDFE